MSDITQFVPGLERQGNEYASSCPVCGGDDRFRVWPDEGHHGCGRFWCRRCGISGDAIDYLREFAGYSFRDACKTLGLDHLAEEYGEGAETPHAVKHAREKARERREKRRRERAELLDLERAKAYMTDEERGIFNLCCASARVYTWNVEDHDPYPTVCDCGRARFRSSWVKRSLLLKPTPHDLAVEWTKMIVYYYPADLAWMRQKRDELVARALDRARAMQHDIDRFHEDAPEAASTE